MNYYLSIIPYLGGMKAKVLSPLQFKAPYMNAAGYCLTIDECETTAGGKLYFNTFGAVEAWKNYFQKWKELHDKTDSASDQDIDDLRTLDWAAHTASIRTSLAIFAFEAEMLSGLEKAVSLGWGHFVEYIASVHFDASFVNIANMQPLLAQRILKVTDKLPVLEDLTTKQNIAAGVFVGLYELAECSKCSTDIMDAWKAAMRTEDGRIEGREIMMKTFDQPGTFFDNFSKIVKRILDENGVVDLVDLGRHCAVCSPSIIGALIARLT